MHKKKSVFSRNLLISIGLFAALALVFVLYLLAENQVKHRQALRAQSLSLADELRQSSDDLTYMARNFVVDGDPVYKKYYQDILDIRDGKKPRPQEYANTYWKLVVAHKLTPRLGSGAPVSLLELLRGTGVTQVELNKLAQAKAASDLLAITELRAMQLVETAVEPRDEKSSLARGMLFGESYNQAKAAIVQPIHEFTLLLDRRMIGAIQFAENLAAGLCLLLISIGLGLVYMLWRTSKSLYAVLGGTLDTIYAHIVKIGRGDFSSLNTIDESLKNTVLGWLAQTQQKLNLSYSAQADMEASLRESESRYRRIVETAEEGIWAIDADANTSFVNPKMAALLGYREEEMLGRPVTEFMDAAGRAIAAQNLERRRKGIAEQHDFKFIHKDGSDRWCRLSTTPVFDIHNQYAGSLSMVTDITARRQTETALQEAYFYTQAVLDNMADGVMTFNSQGEIESFNNSATSIFGYGFDEVLGASVTILVDRERDEQADITLKQFMVAEFTQLNLSGRRKNGNVFHMSLALSVLSRSGRTTYVGVVRDVTLERQHIEEVHRLAFYDPLTELPNRRLLSDRLAQSILTASRTGQHGALMFLDLDHFKQLNDTLGHDIGDELLQQVAMRLQSCVRDCDTVARMGGDEFVVLLEALSTHPIDAASQTEAIAHKILRALGRPYHLCEHTHISTPSIGIVVFLDQIQGPEALFKKADVAMYQAKAAGRNTIRFFDPAMQAALSVRVELEASMRRALVRNEFVLHYQIQVDAQGLATGAEALVRWNHAEHGMISPAAFIPMAEETGMILPIGRWILQTACLQLVEWGAHKATAHWTMAVNISATQFARADFVSVLKNVLLKTGANPQRLKLELTEAILAKDINDVILKMDSLKELGVTFSLDDFGTGYSSLTHLKRLPLDQLKIDQSFVQDLMTNNDDEVIARAVVNLGHSLGLSVIAEGVETLEQRNFLQAMGCDAYQGYYFGYPVSSLELMDRAGGSLH
ncbi:MAG TPA: EAL domain-containing protein [Cellvibrio sp.]|nr:EAL domain-containing protein [Cellvibrio sp.]